MQPTLQVPVHRRRRTAGFTLFEALIALTIAVVASSAVFLGIASALQTTQFSIERTIAMGMAEQLVDEVLGCRYSEAVFGPYQTPLGPSVWEAGGNGRERFNDTDDFHNFDAQPPEDPLGIALGRHDGASGERHPNFFAPEGYFDQWRQEIDVYYVDEADTRVRLAAGVTSNFRAVEARIYVITPNLERQEIARARRVFGHIPKP